MKNVLITAGPTQEAIDPVRFITNHSSGKMGYALAAAAVQIGFSVTLISGPVSLPEPKGLKNFIKITTAAEMADAVKRCFPEMDAAIMCAAVADYRPVTVVSEKMKKKDGNLFLELERTEDILLSLGKIKRDNQILIGFAAETQDLKNYALEKIQKKNLDWIAANQVGVSDRGFQSDNNAVQLYSKSGQCFDFPLMDKKTLALQILETIFGKDTK